MLVKIEPFSNDFKEFLDTVYGAPVLNLLKLQFLIVFKLVCNF